MAIREHSPKQWEQICCDHLRPALAWLLERDGLRVARIEEDMKAVIFEIELAGVIAPVTAQELAWRFGKDERLSFTAHGGCCRQCYCGFSDEAERTPPADAPMLHLPAQRGCLDHVQSALTLVLGLSFLALGVHALVSGDWGMGLGASALGLVLVYLPVRRWLRHRS